MIKFPDAIHPKYKLKIRFSFITRPMQYLEYFEIISYSQNKFLPLDLSFDSYQELEEFLYRKRIIYDEVEVDHHSEITSTENYFVDTSKIYEVEESVSKYLNNYKYYTINEVAEMLSFSRPTVYKWVKEQSLKAIRINGQLRIKHSDLMTFINKENE